MHLKRWITALVLVPLLILLICFGGTLWLAVVINVVCMVALWEYFGIVVHSHRGMPAMNFFLLAIITATGIVWSAYYRSMGALLDIIVLNVVISGMLSVFRFKSDPPVCELVFRQVAGVIYVPLFLSYLLFIRNGRDGISWLFLLFIVVFIGDTGAYYVGSYFGRHKLCPKVSPNKTVEGALGGLLAGLGAGALYKSFLLPGLPWALGLLCFLSINIAGQMGDLFESQLKRVAQIKDSGKLLPGHGGVLDRIDALLFAAPVAYIFKAYLFSG